jgi:Domain of unknown function (DUF4259)
VKVFLFVLSMFCATSAAFAGAWGFGSFENDSALDWLAECEKKGSVRFFEKTINAVSGQDYVEVDEGSSLVAAAEVIATVMGAPNPKAPKNISKCADKLPLTQATELASRARLALDLVADSKKSELAQLWMEKSQQSWVAAVSELKKRLTK